MAHANTTFQKTSAKAEFTDYTVARTPNGILAASVLRKEHDDKATYIRTGRSLRRIARASQRGLRIMDEVYAGKPKFVKVRCGYPKKRNWDADKPSKRGVPHSKFLKQFKVVDRITFERTEENFLGEFVHKAKIYVLHATRGWKFYA